MTDTSIVRLPSFNDFSPKILNNDLRPVLRLVKAADDAQSLKNSIADMLFDGAHNKRPGNVIITLRSTGLCTKGESHVTLTEHGTEVVNASTSEEAVRIFFKYIHQNMNGGLLLQALRNLAAQGAKPTKLKLKRELELLGVQQLSRGTTDHTTLFNWTKVAGITKKQHGVWIVDDQIVKGLVGISSKEFEEILQMTPGQRLFLKCLGRRIVTGTTKYYAQELFDECLGMAPAFYNEDQLRREVLIPLKDEGWVLLSGETRGRGAKSGQVEASQKLKGVDSGYFIERFNDEHALPGELRIKLNTPLSNIKMMLASSSTHEKGLGLELLTLRIVLDLYLSPAGFRTRSKATGGGEVDIVAEGTHLLFSRWTIQCKNTTNLVPISDLAREVGMATVLRAQVLMIVTTSSFSPAAFEYAATINKTTAFQFVLIDGSLVKRYLDGDTASLVTFLLDNAASVMTCKAVQLNG